MTGIVQDVRYAVRSLLSAPAFTAVAVLTLAICIGGNAAVFSAIRAVLLKPPPYADPERLVLLGETRPGTPGYSGAISAPNFLDWAQQNTVFEGMAAITGGVVTLSGGDREPVHVSGRTVSASYFDVFQMRAALGRTFAPDEGRATKSNVVVLSHRLWVSQFSSDPHVIGKAVRLDGKPFTVIGVMPSASGVDLLDPELWTPRDLGRDGPPWALDGLTFRDRHDLNRAVARLKPGVTIEQARTQMETIADRLAHAYPESNKGWGVKMEAWPRPVTDEFRQSLYVLFAAVAAVFVIGCLNLANLALARAAAKSHEVAIRSALGAGRGRLVREGLTESLVIAFTGGLAGLVVGYFVQAAIVTALPSDGVFTAVPSETTITMDAAVWLFALVISIVSAFAFGLGPALRSTGSVSAWTIKERGADSKATRVPQRLRSSLVVAEVALAFVLVTTAGLLMRSFFSLQHRMVTGVDSTNVLTARFPIALGQFDNSETLNQYLEQTVNTIQSLPGIRDVAFAEGVPPEGPPFLRSFQRSDEPSIERAKRPISAFNIVSPSYFRALGIRILAGRELAEGDRSGTGPVVVINETFARTYFQGVNPIGKHLLMSARSTTGPMLTSEPAWEVVGVAADEGLSPWTRLPEPLIYGAREQNPSDELVLIVRGSIDPAHFRASIRKAVSAMNDDQALGEMRSLDQLKANYVAPDRLRSILLVVFATVAVALAAIGLYGVLAYTMVQRRHEIGIRSALGASAAAIVALVVREGMAMTAWGMALGLICSVAVSRLLSKVLFGIAPFDSATTTAVTVLLGVVALAACCIPAYRAARVDSLVALRYE